ncbi:MAG: type II toxin-antitoxin system VapC family toxin [Thermoguttaceae bacterium]
MDIVVDTSAVIAVIMGEPQRKEIIALTRGRQLIAPASIMWEIGNAFSAMIKRKRTTCKPLQRAWDVFQMIPLRYVDVDMKNVIALAAQYNIYAYDAYFLDCALQCQSPLLTLDEPLQRIARKLTIEVMEV